MDPSLHMGPSHMSNQWLNQGTLLTYADRRPLDITNMQLFLRFSIQFRLTHCLICAGMSAINLKNALFDLGCNSFDVKLMFGSIC